MGTWAKYADLGQWNFAVAGIRSTVLEGGRDTRVVEHVLDGGVVGHPIRSEQLAKL